MGAELPVVVCGGWIGFFLAKNEHRLGANMVMTVGNQTMRAKRLLEPSAATQKSEPTPMSRKVVMIHTKVSNKRLRAGDEVSEDQIASAVAAM